MVAILHSSSSTSKSTFTMRCQGHESPVPHGKEFQFKFKYSYQHMHTIMDVCALLPFAKPFSNSQIQTSTHERICETHPLPLPAMIPKSNSYICMCTNMWKMCVLPLLANTIISYSQNYACTKILDTCPPAGLGDPHTNKILDMCSLPPSAEISSELIHTPTCEHMSPCRSWRGSELRFTYSHTHNCWDIMCRPPLLPKISTRWHTLMCAQSSDTQKQSKQETLPSHLPVFIQAGCAR